MAKKVTATVIKEIVPVAPPVVPPIEEQPSVVPPIEEQPPVVPPIEEQPPVVPPIEEQPPVVPPIEDETNGETRKEFVHRILNIFAQTDVAKEETKEERIKKKAQAYLDKIQKEADERTPPVEEPEEEGKDEDE